MWQKMRISFFLFLLICHCGINDVLGGPIPQTFILQSGWNAIFLEVEPDNTDPATVFASISPQLVSVWKWNNNSSSVEFIQNPNELTLDHPNYLTYLPGNPVLTNLHAIHGNASYLVQMNGQPDLEVTLEVTGEPLPPRINWQPNSFNLVGFHLQEGGEPFYGDFFEPFPEFQDADGNFGEIYKLDNPSGQWQQVLSIDQMVKGQSTWVYCRGSSQFTGPFGLTLEQGQDLDFDRLLTVQDIHLKNVVSAPGSSLSLSLSSSTLPTPWLYYWQLDSVTGRGEWVLLPEGPASLSLTIPAGESQMFRLGVKRSSLSIDEQVVGANLLVSDGNGYEVLVPVSVTWISPAGLWVGQVTLDKVNEIHSQTGDTVNLKKTGSEFSFRLMLHVNGSGATNLLNQVVQMWEENDGQAGAPVLVTDDTSLAELGKPFLRDGRPVGRRISAPAFGTFWNTEISQIVYQKAMDINGGSFGSDGDSLTVTLVLPEDDRTNPFVHQYNPDHMVPEEDTPAEKRFMITRNITLTFGGTDGGVNFIGWGSSDVGGTYEETIEGLHKAAAHIRLGGSFRLHKASSVDTLWVPSP